MIQQRFKQIVMAHSSGLRLVTGAGCRFWKLFLRSDRDAEQARKTKCLNSASAGKPVSIALQPGAINGGVRRCRVRVRARRHKHGEEQRPTFIRTESLEDDIGSRRRIYAPAFCTTSSTARNSACSAWRRFSSPGTTHPPAWSHNTNCAAAVAWLPWFNSRSSVELAR